MSAKGNLRRDQWLCHPHHPLRTHFQHNPALQLGQATSEVNAPRTAKVVCTVSDSSALVELI